MVLFVFCKIRTKLRSVTESRVVKKEKKVYVAVSQTHTDCFSLPMVTMAGQRGEPRGESGEPAMTLDGFNTHTLEMATVSVTESVLFPLKQEK